MKIRAAASNSAISASVILIKFALEMEPERNEKKFELVEITSHKQKSFRAKRNQQNYFKLPQQYVLCIIPSFIIDEQFTSLKII